MPRQGLWWGTASGRGEPDRDAAGSPVGRRLRSGAGGRRGLDPRCTPVADPPPPAPVRVWASPGLALQPPMGLLPCGTVRKGQRRVLRMNQASVLVFNVVGQDFSVLF